MHLGNWNLCPQSLSALSKGLQVRDSNLGPTRYTIVGTVLSVRHFRFPVFSLKLEAKHSLDKTLQVKGSFTLDPVRCVALRCAPELVIKRIE